MGYIDNMICCVNCFKDNEIKSIIRSLDIKGNCEVCGKKNVYVYNTSTESSLVDLFNGLLDVYKTEKNLPFDFPKVNLNLLKEELYSTWGIFNIEKDKIYLLVKEICKEKYLEHSDIFDSPVGILESVQNQYLTDNSLIKTHNWEDFVNEIKLKNRFHTNHINKDVLNLFFDYIKKCYKKGTIFYRARISDENGFSEAQMGAPPAGMASAGRANPLGISCLYLSNNSKTTLHEIRAGVFDYVTIGEFELQQDIEVINLAGIDKISPFLEIDLTQYAINIKHLRKIGNEIAKPLKKNDGPLDYLPTQYISDFIKSKGYDGIEYKSTMRIDGYNLAIFDESLFTCKNVTVYDISSLEYSYIAVE